MLPCESTPLFRPEETKQNLYSRSPRICHILASSAVEPLSSKGSWQNSKAGPAAFFSRTVTWRSFHVFFCAISATSFEPHMGRSICSMFLNALWKTCSNYHRSTRNLLWLYWVSQVWDIIVIIVNTSAPRKEILSILLKQSITRVKTKNLIFLASRVTQKTRELVCYWPTQ